MKRAVRVQVTPAAARLIARRGGRVAIRADSAGVLHYDFGVESPGTWTMIDVAGVTVAIHESADIARDWRIDVRQFPWPRLEVLTEFTATPTELDGTGLW